MKNSKIYFRFSLMMVITLLLSVALFAQHGRGHKNNHYNNYNHHPRNYVSVNFAPRYNYQPYYRPYYRPVYRPAYRPVYRSPVAHIHFGPVFGLRVNVLPFGYNRIYVGSSPYYYNQGVYYRSYDDDSYEVVAPPLGASVKHLPANAEVTVIDGQKYYQLGGTFYQEEVSEKNKLTYRVVGTDGVLNTEDAYAADSNNDYNEEPAIGSRYDELPADSKVTVINQKKYFVSVDGVYYQEVIEGNKVRYEVTSVQE